MRVNVSQMGGKLLPVGPTDFEITEAEEGISSAGNPKLVVTLRTDNGDTIVQSLNNMPGKNFLLGQLLDAVGVQLDTGTDEVEVNPLDLIGVKVTGFIEHEVYNGREQNRVTKFTPYV